MNSEELWSAYGADFNWGGVGRGIEQSGGDGGNGGGLKRIVQSDSDVGSLKIVQGCVGVLNTR